MNVSALAARIREHRGGYHAEIRIPWSALDMRSADVLGLDIKINNADAKGKVSRSIWSGNNDNHRFRDRYGLWYPRKGDSRQ